MRKTLLVTAPAVVAVALFWWAYSSKSAPPGIPFAKVQREQLVSTLVTNGKVEPREWVAVRAERSGLVESVRVERGQAISKGSPLAELSSREAQAELAAAESRIAQARAELETLDRGGRPAELAEIDGAMSRARLELRTAQTNYESLRRLADKKAVTGQEVTVAQEQVQRAEVQVRSLIEKRAALASRQDRAAARARLKEAEASAQLARQRIELCTIRSPMSGVVYKLAVRTGAYLNPGDEVASVGRMDKVRVSVHVDEPELGRVAQGMPVLITWDALPGRQWKGAVEKLPTEIIAVGTRQVGEVVCVIDNPGAELLPGTNINAEIRSRVVESALTIPKEALRREGNEFGVFLLRGDQVAWRKLVLGVSSITRTQVLEGLTDGDAIALPTDRPLRNGSAVRPFFP